MFGQQPVVKGAEDVGEIIGAFAGMGAVREIAQHAAARWPVEADAEAEAVIATEERGADFFIAPGGILPAVVVTMDEKADVALVFVLIVGRGRELIGCINSVCPKLRVVGPQTKQLACGDVGVGALAALEEILKSVRASHFST